MASEDAEAKVAENFRRWLQKKDEQLQAARARRAAEELRRQQDKMRLQQRTQAALAEWNCSKNKDLRRRLQLEAEKKAKERHKKEQEELDKQQNAALAYQAWMKNVREADKKRRERQWKSASLVENSQTKMQERRSEAVVSFSVWKKRKDVELLSQIRKNRSMKERLEREQMEKLEARSYEAEQAYLNWLDSLDY